MSDPAELPLTAALSAEYDAMLARLERSRTRAKRLRALADQATDHVQADERMLRSLGEALGRASQGTLDDLGGALRGQRLRQVAVEVLARHHSPGETVHYRDWFELLLAENILVAGKDPLATFLVQISRSDSVESVGRRTGQYRLRAVA